MAENQTAEKRNRPKQVPVNTNPRSGLESVSGSQPHVLILGSYPSEQSLKHHEYYGNPRNQFWRILGMVFSNRSELSPSSHFSDDSGLSNGSDVPEFQDLPYEDRLHFLTERGVAIWDVLGSCSRKGSSDSSICDTRPNDIRAFLKDNPSIRCIALNGKTGAGHWFKRYFSDLAEPKNEDTGLIILALPSTSPAYAGMSLNDKAEVWRGILPFCAIEKR